MDDHTISTVIALYKEGLLSEEEIVKWADRKILDEEEPSEKLCLLSLKGPRRCAALPSSEFPAAKKLTYSERFALRAIKLDLTVEEECEGFRKWVASASLGEDLEKPEVLFGYLIDEDFYCAKDRPGGLIYFNEEMPKLVDQTRHLAEKLWEKFA